MVGVVQASRFERQAVPDTVAAARHAVVDFAAEHGAAGELLENVALAVSEAVSNVVTHAYRHEPVPGPVRVEAHLADDRLVVQVSDRGCGMGVRSDSPGLGLGLPLISQLAGSLEITGPAGATVRMTFSLAG